jgi:hypothetical protein
MVDNPRKKLYSQLVSDPKTKEKFGKYSFTSFENKLKFDPDAAADLADLMQEMGKINYASDFYDLYLPANEAIEQPQAPIQAAPPQVSLVPPQRQSIEQQAAGQATGFVPPTQAPPEVPFQPFQFQNEKQLQQSAKSPVFKDFEVANRVIADREQMDESNPLFTQADARGVAYVYDKNQNAPDALGEYGNTDIAQSVISQRSAAPSGLIMPFKDAEADFAKMSPEQQKEAIQGSTGSALAESKKPKPTLLQQGKQAISDIASSFNRSVFKAPSAIAKTVSELGTGAYNLMGGDAKVEQDYLYQIADKYDKWIDDSEFAKEFIGDKNVNSLAGDVGSGLGQIATMVAAGGGSVAQGLKSAPSLLRGVAEKFLTPASGVAFSQVFSSEFDNMKAKGESDNTALKQALANAFVSSPLESIPLINLAERMGAVNPTLTRKVMNTLAQGVDEATQESIQQIFSNLSNNQLAQLETSMVDWSEGVQRSGEAGGLVGLLLGAVGQARTKRTKTPAAAGPSGQPPTQLGGIATQEADPNDPAFDVVSELQAVQKELSEIDRSNRIVSPEYYTKLKARESALLEMQPQIQTTIDNPNAPDSSQSQTTYATVTPEELQAFQTDPEFATKNPDRIAGIMDDVALIQSGQMDINSIDDANYRVMVESALGAEKQEGGVVQTEESPILPAENVVANEEAPVADQAQQNLAPEANQPVEAGAAPVATGESGRPVVEGEDVSAEVVEEEGVKPSPTLRDVESTAKEFTAEGGNKAVDEKGEPISVYHATNSNKIEGGLFRPSTKGSWGEGVYFADSEKLAKSVIYNEDANVVKANILLKNPLIVNEEEYQNLINEYGVEGSINRYLYMNGYDGAIRTNYRGGKEYFVLEPKQIKIITQTKIKNDSISETQKRLEKLEEYQQNRLYNLTPSEYFGRNGKYGLESVSEAYHKAKADGSNPELVKAVESLLSKEQTPAQQVAALRAQEQAEYDAMPDPNDVAKREEKGEYDFAKMFEPLTEEEQQKADKERLADEANEKQRLFDKAGFDKSWAKDYDEAKTKLIDQYNKAKEKKEKAQAKVIKKSGGKTVFVGDEVGGVNVSVDRINEKNRLQDIAIAEKDMAEAVKDLAKLGVKEADLLPSQKTVKSSEKPTKQQRNKLVGLVQDHNKLPKTKATTEGAALRQRITEAAKALGYTVKQEKGKISLIDDKGKKVNRSPVKAEPLIAATDSEIEVAKKLIDANLFDWNQDPFSDRVKTELDWTTIRKGLEQFREGNMDGEMAKKLIAEANRIHKTGGARFIVANNIAGYDVSWEDYFGIQDQLADIDEMELTPEQIEKGANEFDNLTDQQKQKIYEDYEAANKGTESEVDDEEGSGGETGSKGGAKESLAKRLKGDALLDAEDTLAELSDNGATINPDGTVVVYHRTTKDKADAIVKNNEMFGLEDGVFFSTSEKGQAEGYGDVVVKMNVPIEQIQIDDTFGNEAHVRIPTKKANQKIPVSNFSPQLAKPKADPFATFDTKGEEGQQTRAKLKQEVGPEMFKQMQLAHKNAEKIIRSMEGKVFEVVCP